MRGVDRSGLAVEIEPALPPALANLTVPEVRSVLIHLMKAGGLNPSRMAKVLRCSEPTIFREARELKAS
jgi:hypothetical protein